MRVYKYTYMIESVLFYSTFRIWIEIQDWNINELKNSFSTQHFGFVQLLLCTYLLDVS